MVQYTFKIISAIIYTIRPSATIGACLLVFAAFDPEKNEIVQATLLLTATFFGSAYCFILNDIYDRKKDLLNNKLRPIATGVLPLNMAIAACAISVLAFLISTWNLGETIFLLSFVFLLFSSVYPLVNHKTGFWANVIVSFIVSGTQWGVAFVKPDLTLAASSLFLFFFSLPREVLLDWLDQKGDQKAGKRSLPLILSLKNIKLVITITLLLATLSVVFLTYSMDSSFINLTVMLILILTIWISFLPFYRKADDKHALQSVRISHVTFAFFILAMLSR